MPALEAGGEDGAETVMRLDSTAPSRLIAIALLACLGLADTALAGPREQAKRIHDRLVGIPPSGPVLDAMAAKITAGDALGAAYDAMDDPAFYRTSLVNLVTPWTNVDQSVFRELNDYTATVIGMIRDDVPFDQVLSADLVYVGTKVSPAYSQTNNDHYRKLQEDRVDLSDPALFAGVPQSTLPGSQLSSADTAGVITTRAAGEAFFSAGTNRRMWRFIAINYLCRDMEALKDTSRPADRIRQDVSRSPGGDSSIFTNHCSGCHSGMDPLTGAFAFFEWDADQQRVVFTRGQVQAKYGINANTFPYGYITTDDRWDNYWREGPNSALGWDTTRPSGGFGPKGLGEEVAASRAFSVCQVEKVFRHVCFRPPNSAEDAAEVERIADVFEAQSYSMKRVFAETAVYCMGD
jgi:hypothetical protein